MSELTLPPIVLTLGEPAGVGPEITVKAWQVLRSADSFDFALIAPPEIINQELDKAGLPLCKEITKPDGARAVFKDHLPVLPIPAGKYAAIQPGVPDSRLSPVILASIKTAVNFCLTGAASAMVTNPISKSVLYSSGFNYPGHTEYLAALSDGVDVSYARGPLMLLSGGGLKVALVTIHMPLKEAAAQLSQNAIVEKAEILNGALKHDFGISSPRIALCGLNPHAGENGSIGSEEIEIINPAAQILRRRGINITDAKSADTLFHEDARKSYDAVLAMYHDQGLIPVKTLDFYGGVNTTLGLPFIRTSPDHGTAYDIAGIGTARADSLIAAIKLARDMADNRRMAHA